MKIYYRVTISLVLLGMLAGGGLGLNSRGMT